MSQEQPTHQHQEPIKYRDIFNVTGGLTAKPIAPQDAAAARAAETRVMGQVQRGGVAAVMQSAADSNVKAGLLNPDDSREEGVSISEFNVDGKRVFVETVGGQVLGQYVEPPSVKTAPPEKVLAQGAKTIGQALESAACSAGDKPVDQSDAAAIQAAEGRAISRIETVPGTLTAAAQAAAAHNSRILPYEQKTKLSAVLKGATGKLLVDKPVTAEDAEAVIGAELRNKPTMTTTPGGVAESIAEAARQNQSKVSSFACNPSE
ncbi:late embryogenesis abundant protein D-34-like [Punica granatum]|uniref:Late embryogenesis abundant protein D-34-like n=1 Tax=Punica granatum TaxID=22663 RepID=A0A6P8E4T0_PUNGR|nr:late embryogenesis abundant protein D-34-like [Punica granatum]